MPPLARTADALKGSRTNPPNGASSGARCGRPRASARPPRGVPPNILASARSAGRRRQHALPPLPPTQYTHTHIYIHTHTHATPALTRRSSRRLDKRKQRAAAAAPAAAKPATKAAFMRLLAPSALRRRCPHRKLSGDNRGASARHAPPSGGESHAQSRPSLSTNHLFSHPACPTARPFECSAGTTRTSRKPVNSAGEDVLGERSEERRVGKECC